MNRNRNFDVAVLGVMLLALSATAALSAEGEDAGWTDVAEFSFVATDGNSESTSLGFNNTLAREWDKSAVTFRAGGIRVDSAGPRFAVDGVVQDGLSETTAENYYANGRYDRNISDRLFWFGGLGWDRNEFAGIMNRYVAEGGVGNIWFDTDKMKFKTSYGVTYTDQEDVVFNPLVDETFLGARFAWDYLNQIAENTTFTNVFIVDDNLDQTSDWRADMNNGLAVAMSERLALKLGLRLLYDNEPSFEDVSNLSSGVPPVVLPPVRTELDELDTILTVSLVVDFM